MSELLGSPSSQLSEHVKIALTCIVAREMFDQSSGYYFLQGLPDKEDLSFRDKESYKNQLSYTSKIFFEGGKPAFRSHLVYESLQGTYREITPYIPVPNSVLENEHYAFRMDLVFNLDRFIEREKEVPRFGKILLREIYAQPFNWIFTQSNQQWANPLLNQNCWIDKRTFGLLAITDYDLVSNVLQGQLALLSAVEATAYDTITAI